MVVAAGALHYFGVGGYRWAWVWLGLSLVGGSVLATWWALGRTTPRRGVWVVSVGVLAVVGASVLVDAAPPSRRVLEQRLDALVLPFYEVTAQSMAGRSTCRPRCPRVTRTLRAPVGSADAAYGEVRAAIGRHPGLPDLPGDGLRARGEDIRVAVAIRADLEDGITVVDVTITLVALRGL